MLQRMATLIATLLLVAASASAFAQQRGPSERGPSERGPYEVILETTTRVTQVIEDARSYVEENPERFYAEIEAILGEVVDFPSFARGVMGKYGSKRYYDSLSDADKAKFRDRVERFTQTFRDRLNRTYAKGLLVFDGNRIEVLPLSGEADLEGSVNVEQHIFGNAPQPYVIFYKLKEGRDGWKLRNVSIEGVNLGKTYQSQFSSAVQRYSGDIDKVIENWTVEPESDVATK